MNYQYEYPSLLLLLLLPLAIILYFFISGSFKNLAHIQFSSVSTATEKTSNALALYLLRKQIIFWAHIAALCFLVVAAMNPYRVQELESANEYGFDLVLALDASGSMQENDFAPGNRFNAAKLLLIDFVNKRINDRIGIVLFGADAYVQAPQTTDYTAIVEIINQLEIGWIDSNRTAIGQGLAVSGSRLLHSKAATRIVILITDGVDNAYNQVRPITAAEALRDLGIKVYTIGIGRQKVNFSVLKEIAEITSAKFYRATSSQQLQKQLSDIDQLEKSFIKKKKYQITVEYSIKFITLALFISLIAFLFEYLIWPVKI